MKVPLLDLNAQYEGITDEVKEAVLNVMSHKKFIMGPEVSELEEMIGNYCGSKHAIACASGSDALLLSLMAAGVGQGGAVGRLAGYVAHGFSLTPAIDNVIAIMLFKPPHDIRR